MRQFPSLAMQQYANQPLTAIEQAALNNLYDEPAIIPIRLKKQTIVAWKTSKIIVHAAFPAHDIANSYLRFHKQVEKVQRTRLVFVMNCYCEFL